jgi:hypothetical protein
MPDWPKIQKLWLENCIDAYGLFLTHMQKLVEIGKTHHEGLKKTHADKSGRS